MNSRDRRDGRPLEELGFYNPRTDETRLDVPAIVKRLKEGAQPTETVRSILQKPTFLNRSMPDIGTETSPQTKTPDYAGLVRFLVEPF